MKIGEVYKKDRESLIKEEGKILMIAIIIMTVLVVVAYVVFYEEIMELSEFLDPLDVFYK